MKDPQIPLDLHFPTQAEVVCSRIRKQMEMETASSSDGGSVVRTKIPLIKHLLK